MKSIPTRFFAIILVLFAALPVFALSSAPVTSHTKPFDRQGDCDSLFVRTGKVFAVKNVVISKEEVSFSYCDDPDNKVHTAPWMQITHIKKADGTVVDSFQRLSTKPPTPEKQRNLKIIITALIPLAFLSILIFPLAFVVLLIRRRLLRQMKGYPNEKSLRKLLKVSTVLARSSLIFWTIIFIVLVIEFNQLEL